MGMGFKTAPLLNVDNAMGGVGTAAAGGVGPVDGGEGGGFGGGGGGRIFSVIPEGNEDQSENIREGHRVGGGGRGAGGASGSRGGGGSGGSRGGGGGVSFWSRFRTLWPRKGQAVTPAAEGGEGQAPLHASRKDSLMFVPTLVPTFAAGGPLAVHRPDLPNGNGATPHATTPNATMLNASPNVLPSASNQTSNHATNQSLHRGIKPIPKNDTTHQHLHADAIRELNALSCNVRPAADGERHSSKQSSSELDHGTLLLPSILTLALTLAFTVVLTLSLTLACLCLNFSPCLGP